MLRYTTDGKLRNSLGLILIFSFSAILYVALIRLFLFRTNLIIDKLKLEKGFTQEMIDISINRFSAIQIAAVIAGGYTFIQSLPEFIRLVIIFFQQKTLIKEYTGAPWLVLEFLKLTAGYLLMTNSSPVARYLDKISSK